MKRRIYDIKMSETKVIYYRIIIEVHKWVRFDFNEEKDENQWYQFKNNLLSKNTSPKLTNGNTVT